MGYLLLEGGAEFGGAMSEPDLRAIELAGGPNAPIHILPTAAAADQNHRRAGNNGKRWFERLGARNVNIAMVIDRASANDEALCVSLRSSKLVYLLGGFPQYLGETLQGSQAFESITAAYHNGAVIAGSSAGAMVLCGYYYDPFGKKILDGLNLLPNACVLPHYNTFGKSWVEQLSKELPSVILLGIDEGTGMLNDAADGAWSVYGAGEVAVIGDGQAKACARGGTFVL